MLNQISDVIYTVVFYANLQSPAASSTDFNSSSSESSQQLWCVDLDNLVFMKDTSSVVVTIEPEEPVVHVNIPVGVEFQVLEETAQLCREVCMLTLKLNSVSKEFQILPRLSKKSVVSVSPIVKIFESIGISVSNFINIEERSMSTWISSCAYCNAGSITLHSHNLYHA